jgi:3-deoxy-7-phosphoheptulonate synthase
LIPVRDRGQDVSGRAEAQDLCFFVFGSSRERGKSVQVARRMFVVMSSAATEAEILGVKSSILAEGLTPYEHAGASGTVLAVVGELAARRDQLMGQLAAMPGVDRVTPISRPFKLTSREFRPEDTVIRVLDAAIGDGSLTVMAGPCSVESREQLMETAHAVRAAGATVLRGGAFKPRTSPYAFQGLGVEALRYLAEARDATGLPVITEVMEPNQVDIVAEYADILQIGTRNMQNYSLLQAVGRVARPVMLKRGYGATVEEWLMAAEYIVSSGNPNVILCERGIRTFETYTRNTMDLAAVPLLHRLTHLPVIVDPSHATGKRWLVPPLALGGVAVGADGVMVEVHPDPDSALSDAEQQLNLEEFAALMRELLPVHEHVSALRNGAAPGARSHVDAPAGGGLARP